MKNLTNILSKYLPAILLAILMVVFVLLIPWENIFNPQKDETEQILKELENMRIIDSVRIATLQIGIDSMIKQNIDLKDKVEKNNLQIKELKRASINRQYEVFQYNASSAGQLFLEETGGSDRPPEIILHKEDTCLISPIENITEANLRFVQLDYTLQERDQYIEMTHSLSEQIGNYDHILLLKDSVITIKDGELELSQQAVTALQKANQEVEKKNKRTKRKFYIAAGAAVILGAIALVK